MYSKQSCEYDGTASRPVRTNDRLRRGAPQYGPIYFTSSNIKRLSKVRTRAGVLDKSFEKQVGAHLRREGLRPRHGLSPHYNTSDARGKLHPGSDDHQETCAEKIGQYEVENGNNVEYSECGEGEEDAGGDGDGEDESKDKGEEEDAGGDGDGEHEGKDEGEEEDGVGVGDGDGDGEDEGKDEGEEEDGVGVGDGDGEDESKDEGEEDDGVGVGDGDGEDEGKDEGKEESEEPEVKRPYDLRNRVVIRRSSIEEGKQTAKSHMHVLDKGMGTKANRAVRKGVSRKKRHHLTRESDSDDSLLLDELDEGPPPVPWLRGGSRGSGPPQPFGGLDIHGTTAWGLNAAASGWGHQSDSLAGLISGNQTAGPSSKGGADIQPVQVDESVSFDEIGGLSEYIDQLKEMVFFPLLYPEFFASYNITPPRGVLLCGPPGTGKTLIARALACAASKAGQKVSFYMRKGADVLSKWVGEAERQLKLLFEEAQGNQPSIIFFDEIDGLAPVRSSKQEQIHNSIVSTLLALMDGLDSRGQVILIGATNRVDAIDGALRRPGRFDREFNFPLPGLEARAEILDIHTRKWKIPPSNELKLELAASCVGYCGADLKALCTEAAICSFREKYPQVYTCDDKFVIDVDSVKVEKLHFTEAMSTITPAAHRGTIVHSRPLSSVVAPCLQTQLQKAKNILSDIFPFTTISNSTKLCMPSHGSFISLVYRPRLLLCGGEGVGLDHVGPALLHELEKFPVHSLALPSLNSDASARTPEEALVHIFCEARRTTPSVLYLSQFHLWWENAHEQLKAVLLTLLEDLPSDLPILLLGTSSVQLKDLPGKASAVFSLCNTFHIEPPSPEDRSLFFTCLIDAALSMDTEDVTETSKSLPELLKAPKVAYAPKASEIKAKAESQSHAIRQMRMCLRDVCNRILYDKRFSKFHYPIMDEDEPNYRAVIQNPMDMATLLQRVDSGCYLTKKAFLKDFDLILINAKKYNGDDYKGARIVSRACELGDAVHGMLSQMDPALVSSCEKIAEEGGPVSVPEEFEGLILPQTPVVQMMTTLTQSSARVRNVQPEVNPDQSNEVLKRSKKNVAEATELGNMQVQPESPVTTSVSSSQDVIMLDIGDMSDKIETIKQQLVEHTKLYCIPQLERLHARIIKGAFETKRAVIGKHARSSILDFLLHLAEDKANF